MVLLLIFASYGLAFWYGIKLIMDDAESCIEGPENCKILYDPKSLLVVRLLLIPLHID